MIDPQDYIIKRKRKKYKFAKFANAKNCFEFDEWAQRAVDVVELGAGDGMFSVELATKYPNKSFAAVDVKGDRLQKGAYQALDLGLGNVFFVRARADQVDQLFLPNTIQQIWLNFSDPFPRRRSTGRRLTHPTFLNKYAKVLARSGALLIKHDSLDFFTWTLEQLVASQWQITTLSFDLHETNPEDFVDAKIITNYEKRWHSEGRKTHFVKSEKQQSTKLIN